MQKVTQLINGSIGIWPGSGSLSCNHQALLPLFEGLWVLFPAMILSLVSLFLYPPPPIHFHATCCSTGSEAALGMARTSWAPASHQPWSKVRRPVRLGTQVLLHCDRVPQDELRCLEAFPVDPVHGEGYHLTYCYISSVRSCWSHEPSQGHLGDKDKACPKQSLYHPFLGGHILLSDSGPLNISASVFRKTGNTQILTLKRSREMKSLLIRYGKRLCKAPLSSRGVPQKFFCLQTLTSQDKQIHQGVITLLPKDTL